MRNKIYLTLLFFSFLKFKQKEIKKKSFHMKSRFTALFSTENCDLNGQPSRFVLIKGKNH